ncbi:MAG: acyl-CoA thioesterase [Thermoanaerobaculia bacterium]|nr:acyl-CoA thioesterase [Thermoanaerobaculia bacterium]
MPTTTSPSSQVVRDAVAPVYEFSTHRRVEFADTDMARIVHFSRFFDFMEAAEHEFLRSLLGDGRQVHFEHEGHEIGWPRGRVQCEFHSPAKLGDLLDIRVRVLRKGSKSLTYRFDLSIEGRRVATGEITAICCRIGGPKLQAVQIPAELASRITEAPPRTDESAS